MSQPYGLNYQSKFVAQGDKSLDDMIARLEAYQRRLKELKAAGFTLETAVGVSCALLVTDDPAVAEMYDFENEDGNAGERARSSFIVEDGMRLVDHISAKCGWQS